MDSLKYDSIYKFMVSFGIILLIIPFIVGYNFFYSNDILLISNDKIVNLTPISVKIIEVKQNFIYELINNYKLLFLLFVIIEGLGIFFVIIGLTLWNKNIQDIENKKLRLDYQLMEQKIKSLSITEKRNKISKEIKEIKHHVLENDYLEIENEICNIIQGVFKEDKLLRDIKIEKNNSIDCFIPYNNPNNLLAKAFEIKYIQNVNITKKYLNRIEQKMEGFANSYYTKFFQYCYVSTLLVVDELNDKFIKENKEIIEHIKEYNSILHNNFQICRIFIVDKNNIKEKLEKIKEGKQILF